MALIKCPECGKEISDKAVACPNCGCPADEIKKNAESELNKQNENSEIEYCKFCGKELRKSSLYCDECGMRQSNYTDMNKEMQIKKTYIKHREKEISKAGIICFVLGIISMLTCWFFIGVFPAVIGFVLGVVSYRNKDKLHKFTKSGIALNTVAMAIAVFIFAIVLLAGSDETESKGEHSETQDVETQRETGETEQQTAKEAREEQAEEEESEKKEAETQNESLAETDTGEQDEETDKKVAESAPETFLDKLNEHMSEDMSTKLEDILKNQIGFSDLEFVEKMGETFNYSIVADGYDVVITDVGNDFRIFIPNRDIVFYENGEVITTAEILSMKEIDPYDYITYAIMAESIIESCLKNPSSADFPSYREMSFEKFGDIVAVQGYVDAKNSFNAKVRSQWIVQFVVLDMDTYSCEPIYINIDGEKTGEFIEFE